MAIFSAKFDVDENAILVLGNEPEAIARTAAAVLRATRSGDIEVSVEQLHGKEVVISMHGGAAEFSRFPRFLLAGAAIGALVGLLAGDIPLGTLAGLISAPASFYLNHNFFRG